MLIPDGIDGFATGDPVEDYRRLLVWGNTQLGSYSERIAPATADWWRRAIRAQCRADRIRVRTYYLPRLAIAIAERPGYELSPELGEARDEHSREVMRDAWRRRER